MTKGIKWHYKQRLKKKKKDEELGPVITKKLHESIQKLGLNTMEEKNQVIWH